MIRGPSHRRWVAEWYDSDVGSTERNEYPNVGSVQFAGRRGSRFRYRWDGGAWNDVWLDPDADAVRAPNGGATLEVENQGAEPLSLRLHRGEREPRREG